MRITVLAYLVFALPLAAQAQTALVAPAKTAPVCLRQDMVWEWTVVDDKTLIVTDKVRKAFKVSLKPGCLDLKWPMRLSFRSYSGFGLSCLTRDDAVIVPPQAGMPAQRCFISDVAAYAPPPVPPK
jgi:hypothetical protein